MSNEIRITVDSPAVLQYTLLRATAWLRAHAAPGLPPNRILREPAQRLLDALASLTTVLTEAASRTAETHVTLGIGVPLARTLTSALDAALSAAPAQMGRTRGVQDADELGCTEHLASLRDAITAAIAKARVAR